MEPILVRKNNIEMGCHAMENKVLQGMFLQLFTKFPCLHCFSEKESFMGKVWILSGQTRMLLKKR